MSVSTDTKDQKRSKPEIPSLKSLERDFGQKFAYPASTKTYLEGSRPDIKAPIRMIEQLPTKTGETETSNPPLTHLFRCMTPQAHTAIQISLLI
ncbi:MAG: hypothetical protein RL082_818 [Pseudomonadota bacterium]